MIWRRSGRAPQTTILGENVLGRVRPFAEATGGRSLGFGARKEDEWSPISREAAVGLHRSSQGLLEALSASPPWRRGGIPGGEELTFPDCTPAVTGTT